MDFIFQFKYTIYLEGIIAIQRKRVIEIYNPKKQIKTFFVYLAFLIIEARLVEQWLRARLHLL